MTAGPTSGSPPRYSFCPYDGTRLIVQSERMAPAIPTCTRCGFVDYGNPKPCVAVLIEQGGRVLLARRRVEPAKGMWDIPGGFVDAGERVEQAVAREILEETGLALTDICYFASYPDVYGPEKVPTLNLFFTARPDGGTLQADSDVAELRWFLPSELPQGLAFHHQQEALNAWRTVASDLQDR